jgi:hypothetical protein
MNIQELTIWNRLCKLDLDRADAALPFSARLGRENGWTATFAARAIDEYRKFCFLAVHAGHAVTPSDEVDQVWHLHLLYSQHYWDTLCSETLGMPLHHGPTQGGPTEARKYLNAYEDTLAAYRRYFGAPPADLWPAPAVRFAHDDFVRINRRDVLTLDRSLLRRVGIAALLGCGALAAAHALAQAAGDAAEPSGAGFMALIVAMVVVAVAMMTGKGFRERHARSRRARNKSGDAAAAGAAGGTAEASCPSGSGADCGGGSGCGGGGCGGGGCGGG